MINGTVRFTATAILAISSLAYAEGGVIGVSPPCAELARVLGYGHVGKVQFSPLGATMIVHHGGVVSLYESETGSPVDGFGQGPFGISEAAFSPDEKRVATACCWAQPSHAIVWDTASRSELCRLDQAEAAITGVAYSPDGSRILTQGLDGAIRLWDASAGRPLHTLISDSRHAREAAFSSDGLKVSARCSREPDYWNSTTTKTLRVWDAATGKELISIEFSLEDSRLVTLSPDFRRALAPRPGRRNEAVLWESEQGAESLSVSHADGARLTCAAFLPDGKHILTAADDRGSKPYWGDDRVTIWDVATGESVQEISKGMGRVRNVEFLPDGRHMRVFSSAEGGGSIANVWDMTSWTVSEAHPAREYTWISPDGKLAITVPNRFSGRSGEPIKVFDYASGELRFALEREGHREPTDQVAFSPDGRAAMTVCSQQGVLIWDAATGEQILAIEHLADEDMGTYRAWFLPGGEVLTARDDGTHLWDVATGERLRSFGGGVCAALSQSGTHVLIGASSGKAELWDTATGTRLRTFEAPGDRLNCVALSPDASKAVTEGRNGTLRLWDAQTGELTHILSQGASAADAFYVLAFSPDGKWILAGGLHSAARIWDATSGVEQDTIGDQDLRIGLFSPDGRKILTGGFSGVPTLWDTESRRKIAELRGHDASVLSAVFTPDSTTVLIRSREGTATCWAANEAGPSLGEGFLVPGGVTAAAFSHDGRKLLIGTGSGRALLWTTGH